VSELLGEFTAELVLELDENFLQIVDVTEPGFSTCLANREVKYSNEIQIDRDRT